ncbi:MAG: NAD-dependent epimerase/dehydratase family protein [Actinomycetota bacterium]|nr:NAD-dependent epimerase/dehydratase family protein [Actinomycetota bacterium]
MADGLDVRVLARTAPRMGVLPADVEIVLGDVSDPAAVANAIGGVDVVHHLAGAAHQSGSGARIEELFERVNVTGTLNLARAATTAGTPRLIIYSTIAVYGPSRSGETMDESSPIRPVGAYASSKAKAEASAMTELGTRATTLRLAAVIGPHMKANYRALVRAITRGRFVRVGPLSNRRTVVCETDVGNAAVLVGKSEAALGKVFNVTDGRIHTLGEIVDAIAVAAGRRLPRWEVPLAPVIALAGAADLVRRLGLPLPPARALLEKYLEDVAVSGDRLQQELGFRPSTDVHGCFRAAINAELDLDRIALETSARLEHRRDRSKDDL